MVLIIPDPADKHPMNPKMMPLHLLPAQTHPGGQKHPISLLLRANVVTLWFKLAGRINFQIKLDSRSLVYLVPQMMDPMNCMIFDPGQ